MLSPDQSKGQIVVFIVFTCILILILVVVQQLKFFLYKSLRHFIVSIKGTYTVYETMDLYTGEGEEGGLINGVIMKLRTVWAYKRVGFYKRFYGILRSKQTFKVVLLPKSPCQNIRL